MSSGHAGPLPPPWPLPPLSALRLSGDAAGAWLATHGSRLLGILVVLILVRFVIRRGVPPAVRRAVFSTATDTAPGERTKRSETLSVVLVRLGTWAAVIIGFFLALSEVGYNLAPVITGLGIGGVAIGLGAQSLVKDTINGLFILGENQFGQGDWVTLAGVSGTVEEVNLRRTILRDIDDTVYSIPNSAIIVSSNHTRDFSGINLTVLIPHAANLEDALAIATRVGDELAGDPVLGADVIERPRPSRIDTVDQLGVTLRVLGRVKPGRQAELSFEYRRRLVEAYDKAGLGYSVVPAPAAPAPRSPRSI